MRTRSRSRAVALAVATAAAMTGFALTPTAAYADCSHGHSNLDDDSGRVSASALARRAGPHLTCTALGQASNGTLIYYHCYTVGQSVDGVNTWTWGRIAGTNQQGWFWDGGLNDFGSFRPC